MKLIKIAVVVLIIGGGIVGSYFIIKNSAPASDSASISASTGQISEKIDQGIQELKNLPLQWLENSTTTDNNNLNSLTESIGQDVFRQIQSIDFSKQIGPNLPANFDLTTGGLTKEAIQKKLADFNLIYDIGDLELMISHDNSKEAKIKYLNTAGKISEKDLGSFDKNYLQIVVDVFKKLDVSSTSQMADIYKNLAADYIKTPVPADWLDIHKKIIIHFRNSEAIYRAMAGYLTDPIKGYLAFEMIQGSVDNGRQVQALFEKKAKEVE